MLDSRVVETSVNGKRKSEQPVSRSVEGVSGCAIGMIRRKNAYCFLFHLIMNVHGQ